MLNKVMIIGNLGGDPEVRYMPSGDACANFNVATSERWKDKQTGEQRERTEWHKIAFFGRIAEVCGEFLRKGSKVYVEGSLQTREWTDKEGVKRYTTEIKGREMKMLDKKPEGGAAPRSSQPANSTGDSSSQPATAGESSGQAPHPDDFDDDIPF